MWGVPCQQLNKNAREGPRILATALLPGGQKTPRRGGGSERKCQRLKAGRDAPPGDSARQEGNEPVELPRRRSRVQVPSPAPGFGGQFAAGLQVRGFLFRPTGYGVGGAKRDRREAGLPPKPTANERWRKRASQRSKSGGGETSRGTAAPCGWSGHYSRSCRTIRAANCAMLHSGVLGVC